MWSILVLVAAGCTGPSDSGPALRMEERVVHASAPGPDVPIVVPTGVFALNATITAAPEVVLSIALLSPAGEIVASGVREHAGRWALATVTPPIAGTWSLSIATPAGMNASYDARTIALFDKPAATRLVRSVQGNESAEANLVLEAGDIVTYSFEAGGTTAAWDLHSHRGGAVVKWATGNDSRVSGTFVAPARDTYSLLVNAQNVTLHFEGAFRVASIVER